MGAGRSFRRRAGTFHPGQFDVELGHESREAVAELLKAADAGMDHDSFTVLLKQFALHALDVDPEECLEAATAVHEGTLRALSGDPTVTVIGWIRDDESPR